MQEFARRVKDLDSMGLDKVPVTSVFGGAALGGQPFFEQPGKAMVNSFLTNATKSYGSRFVFTFNFYPYFDPNLMLDSGTSDQCDSAIKMAACFDSSCQLPGSVSQLRSKMQQLTGNAHDLLWVGETGWSMPGSATLDTKMASCPQWSGNSTFSSYYDKFLQWDLSNGGAVAPDHVFYFTARDSYNFGVVEHFGLVDTCLDSECKIVSPFHEPPKQASTYGGHRMVGLTWFFTVLFIGSLAMLMVAIVVKNVKRVYQRRQGRLQLEAGGSAAGHSAGAVP